MVASNIQCIIVKVPVTPTTDRFESRSRSKDLLPGADPYIARLIHNLQDEVRAERAAARQQRIDAIQAMLGTAAEVAPPFSGTPLEIDYPFDYPNDDALSPRTNEWDD